MASNQTIAFCFVPDHVEVAVANNHHDAQEEKGLRIRDTFQANHG